MTTLFTTNNLITHESDLSELQIHDEDIRREALSKAIHLVSLEKASLWVNSPKDIISLASDLEKYVRDGLTTVEEVSIEEDWTGYGLNYVGFVRYAKDNFVSNIDENIEFEEQSWMKSIYEAFLGERNRMTGRNILEYSLPRQIGASTFINLLAEFLGAFGKTVLVIDDRFDTNRVRGRQYGVILANNLRYRKDFDHVWNCISHCSDKILLINTVEGFGFGG